MNFQSDRKYQLDGNGTVEEFVLIFKEWAVNMKIKDSTEFKDARVKTLSLTKVIQECVLKQIFNNNLLF